MDYDTLRLIWWLLLGILLIGFAITDGFDLGVGVLLLFLGKNDEERRVLINAIGPTWEGNQVWFITGGGALFAAWPLAYATAFSGFYFALLLVLFALFFRPIGFDYRSKLSNPVWRNFWDCGLFIGGLVPALVFGIAFGNLLQGVPFYLDQDLRIFYTGTLMDLLNPFALVAGLVSLSMLVMQGAVFLMIKTQGVLYCRSKRAVLIAVPIMLIVFTIAGIWLVWLPGYQITSEILPNAASNPLAKSVIQEAGLWLESYNRHPELGLVPIMTYITGGLTLFLAANDHPGLAFFNSSLSLSGVILTAGFSMFPFLIPSSLSASHSLTIWDASSSQATLNIMFWVTLFFMPVIVTYTAWVYRVLRGKITVKHIRENDHTAY